MKTLLLLTVLGFLGSIIFGYHWAWAFLPVGLIGLMTILIMLAYAMDMP
jgi:hypothetical protein